MKKTLTIIFLGLLFSNNAYAESYFFKNCKLSNAITGNYIINLEKNVIEVELIRPDGVTQNFSDKIKSIGKNKIISEKIKSEKSKELYFQYFLNSKSKSVTKLEYIKQSGMDMDIFKLESKRITRCLDVKGDWDKKKIEKTKIENEQKEILKAQEELKKEQEAVFKCQGEDISKWKDCKGTYKSETGHKYTGMFKNGKIAKGISIYPGGSKYVGEFINFKPDGYGTFLWTNGDRYYGNWKNGKVHGKGTKLWNDGREYSGTFKNDKLHGEGHLYYPDGKKYEGEFVDGKRHGEGTFTYPDGTAFIGKFIAGKQDGLGTCINVDGSSVPCQSKTDTQVQDFSGKDTRNVSIVARKWIRISQYEANSKKGKKIMDQLKAAFEIKAKELCLPKTYSTLEKKMEVLEVDETPAYGLETKVKVGINGVVECK